MNCAPAAGSLASRCRSEMNSVPRADRSARVVRLHCTAMSEDTVVTRFAPSPSGALHLGNARTALFNYLLARKYAGRFVLRIEDTDAQRTQENMVAALCTDLAWLGLTWDEGPDRPGAHAPYRQSQRTALYQQYFERLDTERLAVACVCSQLGPGAVPAHHL